ncbi:MAG: response regulator transcription factor [Planctomycetes bacterium]|nr:response regulator transcription factor [Planctomycetota bacterium]
MNYKTSELETTEVVDNREEQYNSSGDEIRIVIAGGYPTIRRGLMQLINQKAMLGVCVEGKNAGQVLDTIKKELVDMAIVDISLKLKDTNGIQLAERIKLQSPNLPVLILKMNDEALYVKRASQAGTQEYVINDEATEKVIKAVRYVKSLLKSRIYGFTVLVKLERGSKK